MALMKVKYLVKRPIEQCFAPKNVCFVTKNDEKIHNLCDHKQREGKESIPKFITCDCSGIKCKTVK